MVWTGSCTIVISAILGGLLSIPGIPYNVGELLGARFSIIQLGLLAVAILWMGASGAAIAGLLTRLPLPILLLPTMTIAAGATGYVLLSFAVTGESMRDIVGSPVIWRQISLSDAWGSNAAALTTNFLGRYIVDQLEYCGRYIALTAPITLTLAALYCGFLHRRDQGNDGFTRIFLYAVPWLVLCKFIVIDWAGTDNIKELVATPDGLGVGGIYYLYAALFLICLCAIYARTASDGGAVRLILMVSAIALSIPLSWLLLKIGLAPAIVKNGQSFSAMDFLLGPNRDALRPAKYLLGRWAAVFVGTVAVFAAGLYCIPVSAGNISKSPAKFVA